MPGFIVTFGETETPAILYTGICAIKAAGAGGREFLGAAPSEIKGDISQCPDVVEAKERIGDWEGDTIVSAEHNGAIVSLVRD